MMNKGEVNVLKLPEKVPMLGKMMKTKWLLGIISALLAIAIGLTVFLFWPRSQKVYTDTLETVLDKIYTTTTYYDALYPNGNNGGRDVYKRQLLPCLLFTIQFNRQRSVILIFFWKVQFIQFRC